MDIKKLSKEKISEIIALAWCDKTSFEEINKMTNLGEDQVKALMKKELKHSSYRLWRERVKKNKRKHEKKYRSDYNG